MTAKPKPTTPDRAAIKLDPAKATGANLMSLVQQAVQQALGSQEAQRHVSSFIEGAGLEGGWRIQMKGMQFGEVWLDPVEEEGEA